MVEAVLSNRHFISHLCAVHACYEALWNYKEERHHPCSQGVYSLVETIIIIIINTLGKTCLLGQQLQQRYRILTGQ
jgi:hypothetical protein